MVNKKAEFQLRIIFNIIIEQCLLTSHSSLLTPLNDLETSTLILPMVFFYIVRNNNQIANIDY